MNRAAPTLLAIGGSTCKVTGDINPHSVHVAHGCIAKKFLSGFTSVMSFQLLIFMNTHPYTIADRMEDLTPCEEIRTSKLRCDRTDATSL
jgi:hypothetical protein